MVFNMEMFIFGRAVAVFYVIINLITLSMRFRFGGYDDTLYSINFVSIQAYFKFVHQFNIISLI